MQIYIQWVFYDYDCDNGTCTSKNKIKSFHNISISFEFENAGENHTQSSGTDKLISVVYNFAQFVNHISAVLCANMCSISEL